MFWWRAAVAGLAFSLSVLGWSGTVEAGDPTCLDTRAFAVEEIWWVYFSLEETGIFRVPTIYCIAGDQVTITSPDCTVPLALWTVLSAACQEGRTVFETIGYHSAPDHPENSVISGIRGIITPRGRLLGAGLAHEDVYGGVLSATGRALDSCPCLP
jgi:hypothetical protein